MLFEERKQLPKVIKKGNDLIFTQQDLTAREANLFAVMIAHMKPDDWERKTPQYIFTGKQLVQWLKLNPRAVSSQLKDISDKLTSRKIAQYSDLPNGEQDFSFRPLMKGVDYKDGLMIMTPNDLLKNEYIAYNKGFALIETTTYLALKREYTKKLYEILSRFKTYKYSLNNQSIHDLKCFMGLMTDVKPIKLKKNKSSFADNHIFVKRCIRESIKELSEHPSVKKEILFKESSDGLGYKLHKRGKEIVEIEFLYQWINTKDAAENALLSSEALKHIRELEYKHSVKKIPLTNEELELLSISYRTVDQHEQADKVDDAIIRRYEANIVQKKQQEEADNAAFLEKIMEMKILNGNEDY